MTCWCSRAATGWAGDRSPAASQACPRTWAALSSARPKTPSWRWRPNSTSRPPRPINDGKNLIQWRGWTRPYRGTIPRLSLTSLLDVGRLRWQFERIARSVPLAAPWDARRARKLDDLSLGGWLRSVHATRLVARPDGHHGPGDVGMRTRRRLDAARRPLRTRGRRAGPAARRRERRPAGPFPGRHPTDRRGGGGRTRRACRAQRAGAPHRPPRRRRDDHLRPRPGRGRVRHRRDTAGPSRLDRVRSPAARRVRPNSPSIGRRAGSARPMRPIPRRSGAATGSPARRFPTKARCSSPSTSARKPMGQAF